MSVIFVMLLLTPKLNNLLMIPTYFCLTSELTVASASQSVANNHHRRNSASCVFTPLYVKIAVSSYSLRLTTITRGKFYLPMTSQKFELSAKKQRDPTYRDSIKAERHRRYVMDRCCCYYCYHTTTTITRRREWWEILRDANVDIVDRVNKKTTTTRRTTK